MKVTERKNEGLYSEFVIQVPPADVQTQIERRLKEVGKSVKIPGFRPGKAPMALLLQKYGESVRAEVLEKVVEESTMKALKEKNIKPAMTPKVDVTKFDNDNNVEFTVMVEKLPTIEPKDFKKIKLEKPVTPVSDAEIDEALAHRREL
jgi:trigger factor